MPKGLKYTTRSKSWRKLVPTLGRRELSKNHKEINERLRLSILRRRYRFVSPSLLDYLLRAGLPLPPPVEASIQQPSLPSSRLLAENNLHNPISTHDELVGTSWSSNYSLSPVLETSASDNLSTPPKDPSGCQFTSSREDPLSNYFAPLEPLYDLTPFLDP